MKLRIHRNSVRFRLGRSEVERLLAAGRIQEHVSFGPESAHRLWYQRPTASAPSTTANPASPAPIRFRFPLPAVASSITFSVSCAMSTFGIAIT